MKSYNKYIALFLIILLAGACSPHMEDVFDESSIVRLNKDINNKKANLINASNGWVMQYFPQVDHATSDAPKHRGYTFIMEFKDDGSVIVGGLIDDKYKTATSLWDIEGDISTSLTFNSFNSIFHYYSNPDPEMGLWGADGEGIGGDYEFLILEYNDEENYQLLKGKKRGCYIRMYPLSYTEDWEGYFNKVTAMQQQLFGEGTEWDLYSDGKHFSLYNAPSNEFRAFNYGADTLGTGEYYGFITTDKGIRFHDDSLMNIAVNRADFYLDAEGKKLVSAANSNQYITVDGLTAFSSYMNNGKSFSPDEATLPASLANGIKTLENNMKNGVGSAKGNPKAKVLGFELEKGLDLDHIGLRINYSSNGTNSLSNAFYLTKTVKDGACTLTYEGEMEDKNTLKNYKGEDFVRLFEGTYKMELVKGFTVSKGLTLQKTNDSSFVLTVL